MKYPRHKNERSNQSARHPYEITMKYSRHKDEISNESTRHPYEITMKYPRHKNEISNESAMKYHNTILMRSPRQLNG